jgi:signal transduction histidine kinase
VADFNDPLLSKSRLDAVEEILPHNPLSDPEFDRLTRLAVKLLKVPISLVSLVTSDSQQFKGACGLPGELDATRSTPLSHSICKLTVSTRELVVVDNAPEDPRTADNPVLAIGVRSYLGFPLMTSAGEILGAFCVIDMQPRQWTQDEIDSVRDFAGLAVDLIESVATAARVSAAFDVVLHDLRSPLSGMLMASALFKEQIERLPPPLRPLVTMMEDSTNNAVNLVETLSDEDRIHTRKKCEDPVALLNSICDRLRPLAGAKEISIHITSCVPYPLAVPQWVLKQVLENLISNAIKYGPPRSTVWIYFESCENEGHFQIRDEGPGFTQADRQRMFQRYAKLSATPTGQESSTGLGLSIAKRLADLHGGKVELISVPDQSAEFKVSFPVEKPLY